MNRILVVDNYDSFTFNLVHILEAVSGVTPEVARVDEIEIDRLGDFDKLILSPGPGLPQESEALMELVSHAIELQKPILGVCLGHQAMGVATGAKLKNLDEVHHGVGHDLEISNNSLLFIGLPEKIVVGRYHSWVIDSESLDASWKVTSTDEQGEVMSMEHETLPFFGIQFHPESVLTPLGREILTNFVKL